MTIRLAASEDFEKVTEITHLTIKAIYPDYYPAGAVDFFIKHHSPQKIKNDIDNRLVYVLEVDGTVMGTVTVNRNSINRLFVLPSFQGKGYGRSLMDFAEKLIFETYETARIDASFPAKGMYLKRGYAGVEYNIIKTDNGNFLCYDVMEKKK